LLQTGIAPLLCPQIHASWIFTASSPCVVSSTTGFALPPWERNEEDIRLKFMVLEIFSPFSFQLAHCEHCARFEKSLLESLKIGSPRSPERRAHLPDETNGLTLWSHGLAATTTGIQD
jgi:hypothetical protein